MNNLVVWDLDGVLINSRDLHYEALNNALGKVDKKFVIPLSEHLAIYDGLSTTKKLDMLSVRKGLPRDRHDQIWLHKQEATFKLIKRFPRDERIVKTFEELKTRGWKISVASNAVRETVKLALMSIGAMEYVDYYVSTDDIKRSKPFPEMYWKCMTACNALPKNTLIIEDSHLGRQGALDSGAHLLAIENSNDWTYETIMEEIEKMESGEHKNSVPWRDKNLNVLIPMAGAGSRFAEAGYTFPKPIIEVHGKPMIQLVVENINIQANYIFVCQKEHYEKYNLQYMLRLIAPNCKIVLIDGLTEGAACTTLLARELINNNSPLVIINSDQYIQNFNSNETMYAFKADSIDGGILTFKSLHPKYSYVSLDENGFVIGVVEKRVISDTATVGYYYFTKGCEYVSAAEQMIADNHRENGEFYVAPVISYMIKAGKRFKIKEVEKMWSLGTPEDLNTFLTEYKK